MGSTATRSEDQRLETTTQTIVASRGAFVRAGNMLGSDAADSFSNAPTLDLERSSIATQDEDAQFVRAAHSLYDANSSFYTTGVPYSDTSGVRPNSTTNGDVLVPIPVESLLPPPNTISNPTSSSHPYISSCKSPSPHTSRTPEISGDANHTYIRDENGRPVFVALPSGSPPVRRTPPGAESEDHNQDTNDAATTEVANGEDRTPSIGTLIIINMCNFSCKCIIA